MPHETSCEGPEMIEKYSFGRMTIDGKEYTKDLMILSGRVRADWWRKKGHPIVA